jgi:hypothetical protein
MSMSFMKTLKLFPEPFPELISRCWRCGSCPWRGRCKRSKPWRRRCTFAREQSGKDEHRDLSDRNMCLKIVTEKSFPSWFWLYNPKFDYSLIFWMLSNRRLHRNDVTPTRTFEIEICVWKLYQKPKFQYQVLQWY